MTLLSDLYTPAVLQDAYRFCDCDAYFAPVSSTNLAGHVAYIRTLPSDDEPSLFGLHENATLSSSISDSLRLCSTALTALPRLVTASAMSASKQLTHSPAPVTSATSDLSTLASSLLCQLPDLFDLEDVSTRFPTSYHECMNVMLYQELCRYNRMLQVLHASLSELRDAALVSVSTHVTHQLLFRSVSSRVQRFIPAGFVFHVNTT